MDSIIDVLQINGGVGTGNVGETVNDDELTGANYSSLDQHNYDSQEDMIMMAANEEYQPVPAPPTIDGEDDGGGGGAQNTSTNGVNGDTTQNTTETPQNGVSDTNGSQQPSTDAAATQNGSSSGTQNGRRRSRSGSRRRHGSRSRSRGKRDRSRSRSRSRSRHRRSNRRSRSPARRRGGDRRRSPPHRSSNIKHDKDNLKYRWDRTIFVSNIPYEVKWAELKDLFRDKCGDSSVVYCEVYERASDGKSLGVATIEFRTAADAEKAVDVMHSYEMDGRKLSVRMDQEGFKARQARDMAGIPSGNRRDSPDRGRSSNGYGNDSMSGGGGLLGMLGLGGGGMLGLGGGGAANANNSAWLNSLAAQMKIEGPVTKRIFVASLDYKVDEHKLREVYGLAGRVRSVSLFRDRDNKSRGMALIEYDTGLDALNAVAMFNKQTLLDREMNVRFDTKPPTKEEEERSSRSSRGGSSSDSRLPSGLRSIGSGLAPLIAAAATPQVNPLSAALGGLGSIQSLGALGSQSVAPNALTLGALTALAGLNTAGLGSSQQQNSSANNQVVSAANSLANSLNSGGLGSLSGSSSGLGSGSSDLGNGFGLSSGGFSNMSSMNNMNNMNNMSGFGSQMFESSNGGGRNANGNKQDSNKRGGITKIFIKNLPFSWDERRLKEKFSQAGRIEYAEIKKKDGKSRGFGMVRYSYPDQAEKAVELFNGSNFDGRTLEVKLDLM